MRTLLLRSPAVSALAVMIALIAIAWAVPEASAPQPASAQVGPID